MGSALFIVLEKEVEGLDPFVNGKALAANSDHLDQLSRKLGVTPLMDFFSTNPAEALDFVKGEFEAEGEPMPELPPPRWQEQWFSPDDGLRTVRALRKHLAEDKEEPQGWEGVIRELDEFEEVLERASSKKVRWHLAVDI